MAPIHDAAERGLFLDVRSFLELGVPVDLLSSYNWTPLHYAAKWGHTEVVRLLLDYGASVHPHDDMCPLHVAAIWRHIETARVLLHAGACLNRVDSAGGTALHYAAERGRYEMVEFLLDHDAEVSNKEWLSEPLHWSATGGSRSVTSLLLEHGANVNSVDVSGLTPLHCAVMSNHISTSALLILSGADLHLTDNEGRTARSCISLQNKPLLSLFDFAEKAIIINELANLSEQNNYFEWLPDSIVKSVRQVFEDGVEEIQREHSIPSGGQKRKR